MGEMKETGGMGMGLIIFLLILFALFSSGGGLFAGRNGNVAGCNVRSNCDIEKQGIIDSARNQFTTISTAENTQKLIIQEEALTRSTVVNDGNKTREKVDFYAYEALKDNLAVERSKNSSLESMIYSNAKFNELEKQHLALLCKIDRLPQTAPIYTCGVSACGYPYPGEAGNGKGLV